MHWPEGYERYTARVKRFPRASGAVVLTFWLAACGQRANPTTSEKPPAEPPPQQTATTTTDKTVAEKAFDAGMRGRQKAEQLKSAQDQRAQETDALADQ